MTTKEVTSKPKGAGQYITLVVVLLLGVAAVAGIGFYQEEVMGYLKLQAWNLSPVTDGTKQFMEAAAAGDSAKAESFLALEDPRMTATKEGGKLVGFVIPIYGGVEKPKLTDLGPSDKMQVKGPILFFEGDGWVNMEITIPGEHMVVYTWKRKNGAWKITYINWASQKA